MSKPGKLQRVLQDYRARLRQREQQAEQQLEQAYQRVLKSIEPMLNHLYDQMVDKMADGEKIPLHWLMETQRLEDIKKLIDLQMTNYGRYGHATVQQLQRIGTTLGQQSALDMLESTVPAGARWTFGRPSTRAIEALVGTTQAGSPLADLFEGFGREAAQNVADALIRGVTLGDNPRKVARDVQDALGIERARALTISRDSLNNAYRSANLETYRANDDVCEGWIWSCSFSIRTCAVCIAMNGTVHPLSEEFEGHNNDRCVPIPQTRSWGDILGPLGIDTSGIPETTVQVQSGESWFSEQDAATQQAILGKAKYAAYKDGALSLSQLVHHGHDPKWGGYRQEKSLKAAIGAKKASKYYGK